MTPRQWQIALAGFLIGAAVLLQAVIVARLPLPGAGASLAFAVVIAVGMSGGQTLGAVAGFSAGLLLDILPPAGSIMGLTALTFLIAGALAGRVRDPRGLAPAQLLVVLLGLTAMTWVILVGLGWALGQPLPPAWWGLSFMAYTSVLGFVLVPCVAWAMRRVGPGHRTSSRRRVAR